MKQSFFKKAFHWKISFVIAISFICIAIFPSLFWVFYSYRHIAENIYGEQMRTTEYIVNGVDHNLRIYFGEITKITDNLFAADIVQNSLTQLSRAGNISLPIREVQEMNALFYNQLGGRVDVVRSTLYDRGQRVYFYDSVTLDNLYPEEESLISMLDEENGKFVVCGSRYHEYSNGNRYYVVTVGRQLKNLNSGEDIGYLIMDIDYNSFQKVIGLNAKNSGDILFINQPDGRVMFSSASNKDVFSMCTLTDTYLDSMRGSSNEFDFESNYFDWQYKILRGNQYIHASLRQLAVQLVLVCILLIVLICAASWFISYSITKPIHRLEDAMTNAEEENYTQEIYIRSRYYELTHLLACYNKMVVKIKQLLVRQQQILKKQAAAEYQALQMQITPHFLYNSLDSINCLAQIKEQPEISAMVRGLAHIFQYNMRFDSGDILLRDEVEHVKNYCMLQAINYQDRFLVNYHIPPDLMDRHVIKFMLQPLVENAIGHGMRNTDVGGIIEITATEDEYFLIITVKDNGSGMAQEEVEALRRQLKSLRADVQEAAEMSSHIGLANVNKRLGYYYGSHAELTLETTQGVGMAVHIMIPRKKEAE